MKDVDKIYRLAIFNSLNGNISVPIFDEVKKIGSAATVFVLLGGQRTVQDPTADLLWGRRCSIELIITHKTGVSATKDIIDDISNEILEKLFPDYDTFDVLQPEGFQFANPSFETGFINPLKISDTESIMAKVITISMNIIQQF